MAVTYPLPVGDLMDRLGVPNVRGFRLVRQLQTNVLGNGDILRAELAPPYWEGAFDLPPLPSRVADDIRARLENLEGPGRAFNCYHPARIGPADDPLGAALAGFSPVIDTITSDNERIRLAGLPQGLKIQTGDFIAWDYDQGDGLRRSYHRVRENREASSGPDAYGGYTLNGAVAVSPHVPPGTAIGAAVSLVKPAMLAVLVPGSVETGDDIGNRTENIRFKFRQKLKA